MGIVGEWMDYIFGKKCIGNDGTCSHRTKNENGICTDCQDALDEKVEAKKMEEKSEENRRLEMKKVFDVTVIDPTGRITEYKECTKFEQATYHGCGAVEFIYNGEKIEITVGGGMVSARGYQIE